MNFLSITLLFVSFIGSSPIYATPNEPIEKPSLRGSSTKNGKAYSSSTKTQAVLRNLVDGGDAETVPEKKKIPTRRVILRYKNGSKARTISVMKNASDTRAADEPAIKVDYDFGELNTFVVSGTQSEIDILNNDPDVESVEDDPVRYPMAMKGSHSDISRLLSSRNLLQTMPYGVEMVQAPELWAKGATGQGVRVCVIDSGIDQDHPDFETSNLDGTGLWYEDGCGHGTHVAGTISGKDDDAGIIGVAPNAEIFTVRIFGNDCGLAYSSSLYQAARECRNKGANVISMSLGGPYGSSIENSVFEDIFNDGVLLVAAAGNDGDSALNYPASYDSVMSVTAVDSNKNVAIFSQRNSKTDIAAPGVAVLSTFPVGGCTICKFDTNGYGAIDGTSMAAPHVSAVGALLKSAVPNATAAEIRFAMEQSAQDLGTVGKDIFYGNGLVQAEAAFEFLTNGGGSNSNNNDGVTQEEGTSECSDYPPGWHDSDGLMYDCAWYSQGFNCALYGRSFENQGLTASQACCTCNGGTTGNN